MKSFPKILTIFFITIFLIQLICLAFLLITPNTGQAASATFQPQVELPGLDKELQKAPNNAGYVIPGSTETIAKYVRAIYKYAIGIVGILAAVVLMVGGVMWIIAGGNTTMIGEAKAWIGASLTGLVLALLSYLILATVNPALVNLQTSPVQKVGDNNLVISNNCTSDQHLDYQQQDYIYDCGTISLNTCRCVSGTGNNICMVKNQAKDCKPANTLCGASNNANTCEVKKCCAECCSQKCKEGGGLMGVNQIICE